MSRSISIKRTTAAFGLSILTNFGTGIANTATLGLATEAPIAEASFAVVDGLEFPPDGYLSSFGAEVDSTDGFSVTGPAEIGFGVGYSLADPEADASGGFDLIDDTGLVLSRDLEAVGFNDDSIELPFGSLVGSGAGAFEDRVLATIIFDDFLGPNPFTAFFDLESFVASISPEILRQLPSTIPLPTGAALLVGGFFRICHGRTAAKNLKKGPRPGPKVRSRLDAGKV